MASLFFPALRAVITHPRATLIALFTGLGSAGALIGVVQHAVLQIAAVHGMSIRVQTDATQASAALGVVMALSLIIASTGESLLGGRSTVVPPQPGGGGGDNVLPFVSVASTQLVRDSSLVEQKAA